MPGPFLAARRALLRTPTVAVAAATTGWNASDKSANITLSNGSPPLTVTSGTGTYESVRSIASASSGKVHWQLHLDSAVGGTSGFVQGFCTASHSLATVLGFSDHSFGWAASGVLLQDSSGVGNIGATWTTGDWISFALNIPAKLFWVRINGGNWLAADGSTGDPVAGTNGIDFSGMAAFTLFAACSTQDHATNAYTANFGATAYAFAAPSGYGNL